MRFVFLLALLTCLTISGFAEPCEKDDGLREFGILTDNQTYAASKDISQIVFNDRGFRIDIERGGDVTLNGQLRNLKDGQYRIRDECKWMLSRYFDVLAYSITKFGILDMPQEIKGEISDVWFFDIEVTLKDGKTKKTGFVEGANFVPEYSAIRTMIHRFYADHEIWQLDLDPRDLQKISLASVDWMPPKGRSHDHDNKTINYLVTIGKPSIPWLIEQLDDETVIEHQVMSKWYNNSKADVSLVILFGLFRHRSGKPTVPGFAWDEFLERENREITAETVLRDYIEKYGRAKIKLRWQTMWEENKDRISWDKKCKCFKLDSENR